MRPLLTVAFAIVLSLAASASFAQDATAPTEAPAADKPIAPPPTAASGEAYMQSAAAPAPDAAAPAPAAETAPAAPEFPQYKAACEGGFSLAEGNASTRSLTGGCKAERQGEVWLFSLNGNVRYGQARFGGPKYPGGMEQPRGDFLDTENNYLAQVREERALTESRNQYVFLIEGVSGDPFKGFWTRLDGQAGYGYAFVNRDDAALKLEAGVQYNRDYLVAPNADGDKREDRTGGVLTLIGRKTLNEAVLVEAKASYMPNLEDAGNDYRALGETSITAKLAAKVSFKSAAIINYDSEPLLVTPVDKTGAKIDTAPDVPARQTDVTWNNLIVVTIF